MLISDLAPGLLIYYDTSSMFPLLIDQLFFLVIFCFTNYAQLVCLVNYYRSKAIWHLYFESSKFCYHHEQKCLLKLEGLHTFPVIVIFIYRMIKQFYEAKTVCLKGFSPKFLYQVQTVGGRSKPASALPASLVNANIHYTEDCAIQ